MFALTFMALAVFQMFISCFTKADNMALMNIIFFIGVAIFDKVDDIARYTKLIFKEVEKHVN